MTYQSKRMRVLNTQHIEEGGIKNVMLRLYDGGMTYEDLAEHFSLPEHVIGYYMRKFLAEREAQEAPNHANTINA